MSRRLATARDHERARVMREVSAIALQMFAEQGFGAVTMQQVADASEVSVATLYRRFATKEDLVCWQPDEQAGMDALATAVRSGRPLHDVAVELAQDLPDDAVEAIQDTARIRLRLIAEHPALQAAAQAKGESFVQTVLDAMADHDDRSLLEREVEVRCISAAFDAGNRAWLRGEGTLRECTVSALQLVPHRRSPSAG